MKKIILGILLLFPLVGNGTDRYAAQRANWLQKATEATPKLIETIKKPVGLVKVVDDKTAYQGWRCENVAGADSVYTISLRGKEGIVLDMGEHVTGYFSFTLRSLDRTPDSPVRLKFTFAEVPAELATPFDPYNGGLCRAWLQDEVVTVMTIPEQVTIPRRLSFRYIKVEPVATPHFNYAFEDITFRAVTSVSEIPENLPDKTAPVIRQIEQVALMTLRECMQTVYEDGPKRDQRLWIGDLYLEALGNTYSYRQHDLTKRCLYLLAALSDENGYLNATVFEKPEPHPQAKQFLLEYALLYNVALLDYLKATGDRRTAEELWPVALRQIDIARTYLQPNGLMDFEKANREWWVFIDWKEDLHKEVALQGVTIFALKHTLELARILGRENELKEVSVMIKKMSQACRKYYYDRSSGFFCGILNDQVSYASQIWIVLSGITDRQESQRALLGLDPAIHCRPGTPYLYHYYIQALIDAGLHAEARRHLIAFWGGMIEKGADTFWEAYDPQDDYISPYNFHPMNSYCHAWSCTPVYFIRKYPEIFQQY
ncbi:MAG: glycoside hydrolase [Prevotellaceae bacterium]|jgi:hypothetical protein|nr:glycoside hydrolase [Prevotellaceae bacterium]